MNDFRSYKECKECIKKLNKVAASCESVESNFERTLAATAHTCKAKENVLDSNVQNQSPINDPHIHFVELLFFSKVQ